MLHVLQWLLWQRDNRLLQYGNGLAQLSDFTHRLGGCVASCHLLGEGDAPLFFSL